MRPDSSQWLSACALLLPITAPAQNAVHGATLDEVVVTARKFAEDISRVPMSVQALSGEFLDRRDLSSPYDLQFAVPGLLLNNRGMYGAGFSLRGVGDEGGGSLAVASHLNGVYLGRSIVSLARQFDVERVEVVKGPQGTLYGRNATGGSINVITRVPGPEFGAAFEAASGTFNTTRIRGHINLPAERIAARISIAGSEGDGYIRNSVDDRRFAEEDYRAVRAAVRVQPNAAATIDVTVQRVDDDGASGELWLPRRDRLADPHDIRLTTVTLDDPYLSVRNDFASVNLAYDFGALTLHSITGYARNFTRDFDDCAGIPMFDGCVRSVQPLRYEQHSQELRLESEADSRVAWLAGVFYSDGNEAQNFRLLLPSVSATPVNDYTSNAQETAYAVFGDASIAFDERWHLSGGLRFSRETQRVSNAGTGRNDYPVPVAVDDSWDATSWRVSLDFSPNDTVFLYANVSTGFRSGGFTVEPLPTGEFNGFDPEEVLAYEVGLAAKLLNGRSSLRASAFSYDFEDMQVRTTAFFGTRVVTVVDNAAAARIDGLDLSSTTKLGEHLTLTGMAVWMPRREFLEFTDARGNSLSGNKISRASEYSATASIGYRIPLAAFGELSADLDYNYRSEFFFAKENDSIAYQKGFGLLNFGLRFDASKSGWYVFAVARNVLGADYYDQINIQSSPGYPATYEVGFGWRR